LPLAYIIEDILKNNLGGFFVDHFWRINYCLISLGLLKIFEVLLFQYFGPNEPLFIYPDWIQAIMATLGLVGGIILYWAFVQADFFEYWGIKQSAIGIVKIINPNVKWDPYRTRFGTNRLETNGIYKFCRHPMLTGGFLMIFSENPRPTTFLYSFLFLIYVFIGIIFEERRLIRIFGNEYRQYQSEVGAFFPKVQILNRINKNIYARIYRDS
jgi:protein-S-isoprenylcysteine O-methyltransferase Ste14